MTRFLLSDSLIGPLSTTMFEMYRGSAAEWTLRLKRAILLIALSWPALN